MAFIPFTNTGKLVDLLCSQQNVSFGYDSDSVDLSSSQVPSQVSDFGNHEVTQSKPKERRTWSSSDDILLISAWLNTSKDPIVGNEQKSDAFWKRIAAYYSASPKVSGCEKREASGCKNRWQKINDGVSKFCGAYDAATRAKTSGQNEDDVIKHAHDIFRTNTQKKFTLEHCWRELRTDQKWCHMSTAKNTGSAKKRKCGDGSHSASDQVNGDETPVDDEVMHRPPGIKASKARGKKATGEGKELSELKSMSAVRGEDFVRRERLGKMKILERLIAKTEPLEDYEEDLKKKLVTELF